MSEELEHCYGAALTFQQLKSRGAIADVLAHERQAAREPLEARVRELEQMLAATTERAGILEEMRVARERETFDPQAVRELLDVIDSIQAGGGPLSPLLLGASRRVHESEKK